MVPTFQQKNSHFPLLPRSNHIHFPLFNPFACEKVHVKKDKRFDFFDDLYKEATVIDLIGSQNIPILMNGRSADSVVVTGYPFEIGEVHD